MFSYKYASSLLVVLFLLLASCKEKEEKIHEVEDSKSGNLIKYANGFDIQYFEGYKKLIVKRPFPNAKESFEFILESSNEKIDREWKVPSIKIPVNEIVVTSTTHIPMLELLKVEDCLVGFQNTKNVSSDKIRARIDSGKVRELGKEAAINTEVLFELNPDVVIGFAMTKTNKTYNLIEQNGIPVIINGDWLEETPLGRAEWIKFFGVLFDLEQKADSIFQNIEKNYFKAKNIAQNSYKKPTILSGAIMRNDLWSLPGGESFVAQFLRDANLNYLWKDTEGKGSLNLSFESVLEKGQMADYWIAPGYFTSKQQMIETNKLYKDFAAFQNNKIYTPSTKTGKTGGVIYFELGSTRPDLVLKDIIKITNPELLPEYTLTFFEAMQ